MKEIYQQAVGLGSVSASYLFRDKTGTLTREKIK